MSGALVDGHFELLEGLHTNQFFRFSTVARDSSALDDIARWVAPDVRPLLVDAVLAPTTAGVGLGWTLATSLGVPLHLATVDDYGRPSGILGEPHLEDHRILLVNDVMTTGRGMQRMARLAEHRGAAAAAAVWFLSRSELDAEALLGVPCFPVAQWHFAAWDVHACDACAAGGEPEFAYDLN
jgi:orotate phosphoribosyltransferase